MPAQQAAEPHNLCQEATAYGNTRPDELRPSIVHKAFIHLSPQQHAHMYDPHGSGTTSRPRSTVSSRRPSHLPLAPPPCYLFRTTPADKLPSVFREFVGGAAEHAPFLMFRQHYEMIVPVDLQECVLIDSELKPELDW